MQCRAPGPGRCPCRTAAASTSAVVLSSASPGWSLLPTAMSGECLHSTCPAPRLFLPPPLAVPLSRWPPCSCLIPPPCSPGRHFVVLGEYDRSSNAEPLQVLSISRAITHPSWNSTTMNNDVTLLKVASPAQYTTRISPVCLASSNEALTEGLTCVTTGWGRLSGVGNVTPARLQQVALPLVTVNQCRQYWGSSITDSMICAGGAGASSCQVSPSTRSSALSCGIPPQPPLLNSPSLFPLRVTPEALLSARRETHGCLLVLSPGAPKTAMCAHLLSILELASSAPGSTRS
nr:chymotrypsin-like protease CTRL-1 isoform X1 [Pan troglodytes]